jgi:hypothetical protein
LVSCGNSGNRWSAVWAANGTIQTSDVRLKQEIESCPRGLREVLEMQPVTFRWIDGQDQERRIGFLGHEMQKIVPEAVFEGGFADRYAGMNYAALIPVLVRAIQELNAKIESDYYES